jgi:CrcB protein
LYFPPFEPRPARCEEGWAMGYLLVFIGAGIGGALRQFINVTALTWLGAGFPTATLIVNVTGSTVMGCLAGYFAFRGGGLDAWRLFLTTGILGGFTTFSTFSLDLVSLYERGSPMLAAAYLLSSLFLSVAGLFGGLMLMRGALS